MEMHRCSNPHGNMMMGQCTCGMFHTSQNNSFSMLLAMQTPNHPDISSSPYPFNSSSSSSSTAVDCTLSLGTPSTRLSNDNNIDYTTNNNMHITNTSNINNAKTRSSYMPNFCWDILQPKHTTTPPTLLPAHHNKPNRAGPHTASGDPLLARRCANCDTTSTPLWRNGPRGPKVRSLINHYYLFKTLQYIISCQYVTFFYLIFFFWPKCSHFVMLVEFDLRRKKGERPQQTAQAAEVRWQGAEQWNIPIRIHHHGYNIIIINTHKKWHVCHRRHLEMNSGLWKRNTIVIRKRAFHSSRGDSMWRIIGRVWCMTLQDEEDVRTWHVN